MGTEFCFWFESHEACKVKAYKCIQRRIHTDISLVILWWNVIKPWWAYKWRLDEIYPFLKYFCMCAYVYIYVCPLFQATWQWVEIWQHGLRDECFSADFSRNRSGSVPVLGCSPLKKVSEHTTEVWTMCSNKVKQQLVFRIFLASK